MPAHYGLEPSGQANILRKLLGREISKGTTSSFKKKNYREKFKNFQLQLRVDTKKLVTSRAWSKHQEFSKIVEITASNNVVFTLWNSGVCVALSRETGKQLCELNLSENEMIRSMFYNKSIGALITISAHVRDNFSSLHCRSTSLEQIRQKKPESGIPLFDQECLRYPGFVEFDEVDERILTYSPITKFYKVWDMRTYDLLFKVYDEDIQELKIRHKGVQPLKILSIETGEELTAVRHSLHRKHPIEFIEQFNKKTLIKQQSKNLQILDPFTLQVIEVDETKFITPTAFVYLHEVELILTFHENKINAWNLKGELVRRFEERENYSNATSSGLVLSSHRDLLISYYKHMSSSGGSISILDVNTGKYVSHIEDQRLQAADISAIFYNEDLEEIYAGDVEGCLNVWTN